MWISLAIALLTYLLSPKGTAAERSKALTNAALAGGASYLVTANTDWGKDISTKFDGLIGVSDTPITESSAAAAKDAAIKTDVKGTSTGSGLWDTLKGWGATGTLAAATLLGGATGVLPSWVIPVGVGVVLWLIVKPRSQS